MSIIASPAATPPLDADQRLRTTPTGILSVPCRYGYTWCSGGQQEHDCCQSGWRGITAPVHDGTTTFFEAQLADYSTDGDSPGIDLDVDGRSGCSITPAQLRAVVADGHRHLDWLAQLADEFDALYGGAR